LIGFVLFTGCTSYFSNLTAPKRNLSLNQTAIFDQDGYQFAVAADRVTMSSSSADYHVVTVHITVKNSGQKALSLIAYPRLSDASGKEYSGNSIFLGAVNTGGMVSGESSITIGSKEDYDALREHAVLSVRFQGAQPTPWEANWDVDVASLH
jgi:hypothetical protein